MIDNPVSGTRELGKHGIRDTPPIYILFPFVPGFGPNPYFAILAEDYIFRIRLPQLSNN